MRGTDGHEALVKAVHQYSLSRFRNCSSSENGLGLGGGGGWTAHGSKGLIMRGLRLQVHVSICKRQTSSWHICGRFNQPQLRESQASRKRDGHAAPEGRGGWAFGEFNVTKYVLGPCRLRSIP